MTTITTQMAALVAVSVVGVNTSFATFPDKILQSDTLPAKVVLWPVFSQDVAFQAAATCSDISFQQVNKIIFFIADITQGYNDVTRTLAIVIADAAVSALRTAINANELGLNANFTGTFGQQIVNKRTFRTVEILLTSTG